MDSVTSTRSPYSAIKSIPVSHVRPLSPIAVPHISARQLRAADPKDRYDITPLLLTRRCFSLSHSLVFLLRARTLARAADYGRLLPRLRQAKGHSEKRH